MVEMYPKRNVEKIQAVLCAKFKKNVGTTGILMGIDYGSVRIGIALSDENRETARPFKIISKIKELDDLVPARNVVGFVIGLPLQPDGTEGETARQARLFAARLEEKYKLPILWIDERYSSVETEDYLKNDCFMRLKQRRQILDAHVAARLLQYALNFFRQIK